VTVAATSSDAKPAVRAAVLLWARELVGDDQPWPRTVAEVLDRTGSGKSQAYVALGRLRQAAASLDLPCGRPVAAVAPDSRLAVLLALRDFLIEHPGAVAGRGTRQRYSATFRRFAVELLAHGGPGAALPVERLAELLAVPPGTLKDWLRLPRGSEAESPHLVDTEPVTASAATQPTHPLTTRPEIATILTEWPAWQGTFGDFCRLLREQHRLPFGNTFISSVLEAAGLRSRRPRRRPAAPWSRDTFRILFPGAQWVGDGTTVALRVNDEQFAFHRGGRSAAQSSEIEGEAEGLGFNVEAILDPAPGGALVGVTVTDSEDEQAVLAAFGQGCLTTGEPPLALTLDNRPSNHSPAVE